jgi:Antitoxin to bacterial toxin RNase LS or RnlA
MSNFHLIETQHTVLAIGKNYQFPNISQIEEQLASGNFTGILYIDALLSNGPSPQRFCSAHVSDGIVDRKSMIVIDHDPELLETSATFFKQNPEYVYQNMILSDDEKNRLLS